MYIPLQIQPLKPTNRIQCIFYSKTDSTIKPSNRIQCQFHSMTDSNIKPINRIQCILHSKTDSSIKPTSHKSGAMYIPLKDRFNH